MNENSSSRYLVEAVVRACEILRSFRSPEDRLSLSDIVERTALTPSRAFRLLRTLEHEGLVDRSQGKLYRLRIGPLDRPAFRIGYAGQTPDSAFAVEVAQGVRSAAAARNVQLVELDNRYSAEQALRNADRLIRERVDLAIEFQTFADAAPAVAAKFREAGIPLIAIDIPHPGAVFFGADNYRAGLIAGRALGRWTRREWAGRVDRVVLVGMPAAGPLAEARLDGTLAGIEERLRVGPDRVLRMDGDGRLETAWAAARDRLRPNERTLVAGVNDPMVLGVLRAAEEAGMAETTAGVGQGASAEGRRELRRVGSRLIGSVGYFPESYGERILELAIDILNGKPSPPAAFVDHELITPRNVRSRYPADAETTAGRVETRPA